MEINMTVKNVANAYKETDQEYIKGIETPHGRIKLLYEKIITNIKTGNILLIRLSQKDKKEKLPLAISSFMIIEDIK